MGLVEQAALTEAFIVALRQIREALLDLLEELFTSPRSWRDGDVERFVARAVPAVEGAQRAAATLTEDYLSRMIADQARAPYRPRGNRGVDLNRVTGSAPRNGVPLTEVYRRPYNEVWSSLGRDRDRAEQVQQARRTADRRGVQINIPDLPAREPRRTRVTLNDVPASEPRRARVRFVDADGNEITMPSPTSVRDAVERGQRRARLLGATDVELAVRETARERLAAEPGIQYYRRVLTGESCGLCIVAATQRYRTRDLMPIHPNCVPEGTRVSAQGVKAVSRRRYTGELTIIATASGDELTITAQHPVLTEQGWVPAHLVREGMHVLRSLNGDGVSLGGPDEGHRPTLIEDVWRAAQVFPVVRVPMSPEDFHGDGSDGEVDVVDVDGSLHAVLDAQRIQVAGEGQLVAGDRGGDAFAALGTAAQLVAVSGSTSDGVMGGLGLLGALLGGHLGGSYQPRIGAAAALDVAVLEHRADGAPLDAVLGSKAVLRRAAEVLVDDFLRGQVTPGAAPRRYDPAGAKFAGEGLGVYADRGRSLLDRLAGEVELDRVVDVRRVDTASCHVYNLHTDEGWYVAGGMIVSNCDCVVAPILGDQDPGHVINTKRVAPNVSPTGETRSGVPVFSDDQLINMGELLEDVHKAIEAEFGMSARDARRIDYRKVLLVEQHGELGPVLTVSRHKFSKRRLRDRDLSARRR